MMMHRTRAALLLGALLTLLMVLLPLMQPAAAQADANTQRPRVVMAIHGGAGSMSEMSMSEEEEARYRAKMTEALEAGYAVLSGGGSSVDAVVAAITIMESSPLFNAGVGAVFTSEGTVEHDASIMYGASLRAGAVAGTKHIEHPIALARLVMEESRHVMLAREGAEVFAEEHGIEMVPNDFFYTEERRARFLQRQQEQRQQESQESGASERSERSERPSAQEGPDAPAALRVEKEYGTVGAVALDREGNLAAGTSTGGMSNKRWGRIGDSPIIGAGTYANNETCAVSATGYGEYFIRGAIAHTISAMMNYAGLSVAEAASATIYGKLPRIGNGAGTGGVIALDAEGNLAMPFNTPGMFRGYVSEDGAVTIRIYKDSAY